MDEADILGDRIAIISSKKLLEKNLLSSIVSFRWTIEMLWDITFSQNNIRRRLHINISKKRLDYRMKWTIDWKDLLVVDPWTSSKEDVTSMVTQSIPDAYLKEETRE